MRKDQYEIKKAFKKPIYCTNLIKSATKTDLSETIIIDDKGNVFSDGHINLIQKHMFPHFFAIIQN